MNTPIACYVPHFFPRRQVLLAACLNNVGQATTYVARVGPGTKPDGFGTPGDRPKNQQENDDLMGLNHDSL